MKPISLKNLIDSFEISHERLEQYYALETGEIIYFHDEYGIDEDYNLSDIDDFHDWQKDQIKEIFDVRNNFKNYIALPSREELNEYGLMVNFAAQVNDEKVMKLLNIALQGKGAFSRFYNNLECFGLKEKWYEFKKKAYTEKAVAWCNENSIPYID
jgi:hypothetical protein